MKWARKVTRLVSECILSTLEIKAHLYHYSQTQNSSVPSVWSFCRVCVWILVVQRETIHKQTHVHSPKNCLWSSWEHLLRGVCCVKPIHEKPFIRNKQLSCMYACETAGNSWEHRNSKIDITAKATCFHFMQMLYILLLSFDYDGFWRKKDMVTL